VKKVTQLEIFTSKESYSVSQRYLLHTHTHTKRREKQARSPANRKTANPGRIHPPKEAHKKSKKKQKKTKPKPDPARFNRIATPNIQLQLKK
jgi:hypothetical protein